MYNNQKIFSINCQIYNKKILFIFAQKLANGRSKFAVDQLKRDMERMKRRKTLCYANQCEWV